MKNNTRTCIATHKEFPKGELIRVVKTKDNKFFVDQNMQGRGCYFSKNTKPEDIIKKRYLHRAFKTEVPKEVYDQLIKKLEGEKYGQEKTE